MNHFLEGGVLIYLLEYFIENQFSTLAIFILADSSYLLWGIFFKLDVTFKKHD